MSTSSFEGLTQISGHETGPELHNARVRLVEATSHARSILAPRMPNNPLIEGFSNGKGSAHLGRLITEVSVQQASLAIVADDSEGVTGGIVYVGLPEGLNDSDGNLAHFGLFVDALFVGQDRPEQLASLFGRGAKLAKTLLGETIEIKRFSISGRSLRPTIVKIPQYAPILALEVSPDSEMLDRNRLRRFFEKHQDVDRIRAIRTEANEAIVEAGFGFVTEANLQKLKYPKTHVPGRYSLYQV